MIFLVFVFSDYRGGGAPAGLPHEPRQDNVQLLGHSWPGEVWRPHTSKILDISLGVLHIHIDIITIEKQ
jgi:hypothetical protein